MKQSCYCPQSPVLLSSRQGKMDTGHGGGDQLGTGRAVRVPHPTRGLTLRWAHPFAHNPSSNQHKPRGSWGLEKMKSRHACWAASWRKGSAGKGDFS